jgi:hypothetical protein
MKAFLFALAMSTSFVLTVTVQAQAPVTATCKDGTSYSGTARSGACGGHGGVQTWGTAGATPPAATATKSAPPAGTSSTPAGGPGQVWVNTASHVYHCPGTQYYGKTKAGTYMTEAAAKTAGNHPDHGKACS